MGKELKIYAVYSFMKFLAASVFLLTIAIQKKEEIMNHYTVSQCMLCYNAARAAPGKLFEFGPCSDRTPSLSSPNLMVGGGHVTVANLSSVSSYTMWGFFTVMMALTGGLAIVYFTFSQSNREQNRPYVYLTMLVSFFVIAMFLMLADSIFSLYMSGGCYVGVVSANWLFAGQMIVGALTLMFALSTMVVSSDMATISMVIATICLFVVYAVYCLTVAFMHYLTNHDWKPIAFAVLCFVSIFEVPIALFGAGMVKELFTFTRTRRPHDEQLGGAQNPAFAQQGERRAMVV